MQSLDPQLCRRARLARDHRFDGEFFLAVKTTGIYCRPICPARPPREQNVSYYRSAAEAAQAGFRPCLRCRPESAPLSPAWRGTDTTVSRALQLINEGYLNQHPLESLADRLGVGERYLRKLFKQKLGVAPSSVAQTQRLHFAQKLLLETSLPLTEVAFASGFGSIRRFNSATRACFGCAASELRRRPASRESAAGIELELFYRPPYDWDAVYAFYTRHAVTGIEQVSNNHYRRNLATANGFAIIDVSPHPDKHALRLRLELSHHIDLMPVVATVRRMFDLDAQPALIAEALQTDPALAALAKARPGVRAPVTASVFESCVRAVLGQQVSTQAARKLCAGLIERCDNRATTEQGSVLLFPTPTQLSGVPESALRMPASRRQTFRTVCEYFATAGDMSMDTTLRELASLRGIGPWTISILAMRGYGDPDHFPLGDLALVKAAQAVGIADKAELKARSESWAPWRSYAANLLWRSLGNG